MLSLIEKELLQAIVDIRTEAPDAVPRLMALERAFRSVAGRIPTPADYAELGKEELQ